MITKQWFKYWLVSIALYNSVCIKQCKMKKQGAHFTTDFVAIFNIQDKFHFSAIRFMAIRSCQFCTCHGSCAVVAGAKVCSNHFMIMWVRVEWNFCGPWSLMEKLLVKWAPGLTLFVRVNWLGLLFCLITTLWWWWQLTHWPLDVNEILCVQL